MGRKPRNPVIEFEGERFTRLHSGFYAGYYRMTREPRTMLHRFAYLKHHGPIKRGHDVIYMDGSRENVAADNLLMVTRAEARNIISSRLHKLEIKRCLACDQPMGRRVGWDSRECPAAYAKRKTCNPQCAAQWKKGKRRGARMPC
jgi:hypothetical protein